MLLRLAQLVPGVVVGVAMLTALGALSLLPGFFPTVFAHTWLSLPFVVLSAMRYSPVIWRRGCTVIPGLCISTSRYEIPRCLGAF